MMVSCTFQVSQTVLRSNQRSQIAIPAQGMIEFRDALTDLLDEFGTDDHGQFCLYITSALCLTVLSLHCTVVLPWPWVWLVCRDVSGAHHVPAAHYFLPQFDINLTFCRLSIPLQAFYPTLPGKP